MSIIGDLIGEVIDTALRELLRKTAGTGKHPGAAGAHPRRCRSQGPGSVRPSD
jgi:hypothetical protein